MQNKTPNRGKQGWGLRGVRSQLLDLGPGPALGIINLGLSRRAFCVATSNFATAGKHDEGGHDEQGDQDDHDGEFLVH